MKPRIYYRDKAHREIILEALSACKHVETGALFLKHPIYLGHISFWESEEDITLAGVDSNSGRLFDCYNRIIRYRDLSTLWLLKLHRLIVKKKQYEIRKEDNS